MDSTSETADVQDTHEVEPEVKIEEDDGIVDITVKLPTGDRDALRRRFRATDTIGAVLDFVDLGARVASVEEDLGASK